MKARAAIGLVIASLLLGRPASAEDLAQAWAIALRLDSGLEANRLDSVSAALDAGAAEAARLGSIRNFSVNTLVTPTPGLSTVQPGGGGAGSGFGFLGQDQNNVPVSTTSWIIPIFTGGRLLRSVDEAEARVSAARARELSSILDLKLEVAEAYINVLRAEKQVGVTGSNVDRLESFLVDVSNRRDQGLATLEDELSAEVALGDARQRDIEARASLQSSWENYNRLLRRPPMAVAPLQELRLGAFNDPDPEMLADRAIRADPALAGMLEEELQGLVSRAIGRRPELSALEGEARSLSARADVERAGLLPQVYVSAGHLYFGNRVLDDKNYLVGIAFVDWTLTDFGATRRRSESLRVQHRAVLRRKEDLAADIALQVRTRWLELRSSIARIPVSLRAVDQAEEALSVSIDRYREGLNLYSQVLEAEARRVRAYSDHYDAHYDATLAALRLRRAVGDL